MLCDCRLKKPKADASRVKRQRTPQIDALALSACPAPLSGIAGSKSHGLNPGSVEVRINFAVFFIGSL